MGFRIKPHTNQRCSDGSNKICTPGPRDPTETEPDLPLCVSLLWRHGFNTWVGRFPWRRKQQPTQCSCLENAITGEPGALQSLGWQESGTSQQLNTDNLSFIKGIVSCIQPSSPTFAAFRRGKLAEKKHVCSSSPARTSNL